MSSLTTSALVVLGELVDKGPMTPKQIRGEVDLSQRTVGDALRRLTDSRLCKKVPNLRDMRQPLYYPNKNRMKEMEISLDHVRAVMNIHMKVV